MKLITILIAAMLLTGCGKISDTARTTTNGYVTRCIDGTQYIIMSSAYGLAITPHLGTDGKPKGCSAS